MSSNGYGPTFGKWKNQGKPVESKSPTRIANEARLLARIQKQVPIEHTSTTIAGQEYPWTRVVDPDSLLLSALSNVRIRLRPQILPLIVRSGSEQAVQAAALS